MIIIFNYFIIVLVEKGAVSMFLDGTTSVEFYKTGFFGYGEKGDFKFYSFWHFLPIIILVLAIILTYIFREKIRNCKHESTIRFIIGVFL